MYQFKEKYTIDFTNVTTYMEMHLVIKEALDFPDYYGYNWSAFWDCLTDMYGEPVHIEIKGLERVSQYLGDDVSDKLIEILKRFKHFEESFEDNIKIEIITGSSKTSLI